MLLTRPSVNKKVLHALTVTRRQNLNLTSSFRIEKNLESIIGTITDGTEVLQYKTVKILEKL